MKLLFAYRPIQDLTCQNALHSVSKNLVHILPESITHALSPVFRDEKDEVRLGSKAKIISEHLNGIHSQHSLVLKYKSGLLKSSVSVRMPSSTPG